MTSHKQTTNAGASKPFQFNIAPRCSGRTFSKVLLRGSSKRSGPRFVGRNGRWDRFMELGEITPDHLREKAEVPSGGAHSRADAHCVGI